MACTRCGIVGADARPNWREVSLVVATVVALVDHASRYAGDVREFDAAEWARYVDKENEAIGRIIAALTALGVIVERHPRA
jgi:hypothetical protein